MCLGGIFPCYAHGLAHGRLKHLYLGNPKCAGYDADRLSGRQKIDMLEDPFYPRWWPSRLEQIRKCKRPVGIFLDDMSDWMGDYWPEEWTEAELQVMRDCRQHRFYTLTKQPQNLIKFSPFPPNCWVGVTATDGGSYTRALRGLAHVDATIKFISFEPLLADPVMLGFGIDKPPFHWAIIGALTGSIEDIKKACLAHPNLQLRPYGKKWSLQPKLEWVEEIVRAADKAGVAVFLKDNLKPLLKNEGGWTLALYVSARDCDGIEYLRHEMPSEKEGVCQAGQT
jgi:protein gp37